MATIDITIVYDNINGYEKGFKKDFGFSALLEQNSFKILFDTGTDPDILSSNLEQCNVAPANLNAIILSHNHYDHTNGITSITSHHPDIPVIVHKYWNRKVVHRGTDISTLNLVEAAEPGKQNYLPDNFLITAPLPSPDYGMIDEQALFIKTAENYILLCGCCHPGLINFLDQREILGINLESNLNIIGGFHGFSFPDKMAAELYPIIDSIVCCHCTKNRYDFKQQFSDKCSLATLGKKYSFAI